MHRPWLTLLALLARLLSVVLPIVAAVVLDGALRGARNQEKCGFKGKGGFIDVNSTIDITLHHSRPC